VKLLVCFAVAVNGQGLCLFCRRWL